MAELTHFYNEVNAAGSRSSLSWSNTMTTGTSPASIAGTSLSPNTKYLIIARALFGGEDISSVFRCRVSTADDTTIETKSEMRVEFQNANTDVSYFFVHSYTTDSSPADVEFQLYGNNVVDAQIDQSSLFLLDLDAIGIEGTDYYEDIQAVDTGTEYSTDPLTTVLAQITSGDLGTDPHLILGYARVDVGSTGRWYRHTLQTRQNTVTIYQEVQAEGEDTAEQRITGYASYHQSNTGSHPVSITGQEEANNGNMTDGGAYLIALPTSLFADFEFVRDPVSGIDGTESTLAGISNYTPSVNGNHLIFGQGHGAPFPQNPDQLGGMHVEEGTTEIRTGDSYDSGSGHSHNQLWDTAKDWEVFNTFQRYSISSQVTLNLRAQGAAANFDMSQNMLLVVNLNEPAPPPTIYPPFPRRKSATVRM